ncbi:hypothetical protein ABTQ33_00065 [Paucilactobacillus suebicus]|uniref:hypothetical protein n=1 Tax=Paucilactobacillus suebicus TaxID=152335 RepID=UPI003364E025
MSVALGILLFTFGYDYLMIKIEVIFTFGLVEKTSWFCFFNTGLLKRAAIALRPMDSDLLTINRKDHDQ